MAFTSQLVARIGAVLHFWSGRKSELSKRLCFMAQVRGRSAFSVVRVSMEQGKVR